MKRALLLFSFLLAPALVVAAPSLDTNTLCAEKWAGRRAIRVRLERIQIEYDWEVERLAVMENNLDQLTAQIILVQTGRSNEMTLPSSILACAGFFSQSITQAKVIACYNDHIGRLLKEVRAQRKVLRDLRDMDRVARREASAIRDIAAEMKCPEPPPLDMPPLPEPTPLKEPKPLGVSATPEPPTADATPPTLSQPAATSLGDLSPFIGKWTGTIKITTASEPAMMGISETGTIEIFAAGKGVGVKGRLGVIGDPAAYQVKVSGNHLQIHYTGPSHTTATTGIPATLDYTLNVTCDGNHLIGESSSKATSTYLGNTAVVSFTQKMDLNR